METAGLNILVIDDAISHRSLIKNALDSQSEVRLVDTVPNGELALRKMSLIPYDLVYLDLEMQGLSGAETARKIHTQFPHVYMILMGELQQSQIEMAMQVKELLAHDGILKKDLSLGVEKSFQQYLRKHRKRSEAPASPKTTQSTSALDRLSKINRASEATERRNQSIRLSATRPSKIDIVAIGVSTGGPVALGEVIPFLPADLGVPVVLVQHMPPNFTGSLAETLAKRSHLQVKEASENEAVVAGKVLIAPGGKHMVLKPAPKGSPYRCVVDFNLDPPENSCRPAADVLFRSVADCYNGNILVVIMTGMGSDGKEGVKYMKQNSCICLTQSAETCVVYGMPMAVDEAGLSDESVPLQHLAERIEAIVRRPGARV